MPIRSACISVVATCLCVGLSRIGTLCVHLCSGSPQSVDWWQRAMWQLVASHQQPKTSDLSNHVADQFYKTTTRRCCHHGGSDVRLGCFVKFTAVLIFSCVLFFQVMLFCFLVWKQVIWACCSFSLSISLSLSLSDWYFRLVSSRFDCESSPFVLLSSPCFNYQCLGRTLYSPCLWQI